MTRTDSERLRAGHVLAARHHPEAASQVRAARVLFETKGDRTGARQAQALEDQLADPT